jgi:hypothetical protein
MSTGTTANGVSGTQANGTYTPNNSRSGAVYSGVPGSTANQPTPGYYNNAYQIPSGASRSGIGYSTGTNAPSSQ